MTTKTRPPYTPSAAMRARVLSALDPVSDTWIEVTPLSRQLGVTHMSVRGTLRALIADGTVLRVAGPPASVMGSYRLAGGAQ